MKRREAIRLASFPVVTRQGADIIVGDRAFDATIGRAPGKMEDEHWC